MEVPQFFTVSAVVVGNSEGTGPRVVTIQRNSSGLVIPCGMADLFTNAFDISATMVTVDDHRLAVFFDEGLQRRDRSLVTYLFVLVDSDNFPLNLHAEHDFMIVVRGLSIDSQFPLES